MGTQAIAPKPKQEPVTITREVVVLRQDVAPSFYHGPWDAAVAAAAAGVDGVRRAIQKGTELRIAHTRAERAAAGEFVRDANSHVVRGFIAPAGWAAFYKQPKSDRMWLHFQNY